MSYLYSLSLSKATDRLLSFSITNENDYLPSTVLPLFDSPKHAREYRDDILRFTHSNKCDWNVSICKKTQEATLQTKFEFRDIMKLRHFCEASVFDYDEETKKLITLGVGGFMIDDYNINYNSNILTVNGFIWNPAIEKIYYDDYVNLSNNLSDDDDFYKYMNN